MTKIVVLGAGVMGSTLAKVASENNNVLLVGSPLDNHIIDAIENQSPHPDLDVSLPRNIIAIRHDNLNQNQLSDADVIVLGVSSPGVTWALDTINRHQARPNIVALVTKGLVSAAEAQCAPQTYAEVISSQLTEPTGRIVGIGGPCIARELALEYPTRVSFAAKDKSVADDLRRLLTTDYYHVTILDDFTGLEACAALKNFICIGVSAMFTAYKLDDGYAKNPVAALFNQGVHEIAVLSQWIKASAKDNSDAAPAEQHVDAAFDLAGLGDLHVTVGGGRNSRLGRYLGVGRLLRDVLGTDMRGVTVEGVDTGKQLLPGFRAACTNGELKETELPLTSAILDVIEHNYAFSMNFNQLPH